MEIDLEKAIHFDPEKIKKMYGGDYKKVAKDLAIENTKIHIINSSKEQEIERLNNIIKEVREYIKEHNVIAVNKEYLPKNYEYCCSYELLEILDKEKE